MTKPAKKPVREVLRENVATLKNSTPMLASGASLGRKAGKAQKTVWNLEHTDNDPQLSSIDAVAESFNLEAFQLLVPHADKTFFLLCRAYNVARGSDKEWLADSAETILRKRGADNGIDKASEGDAS